MCQLTVKIALEEMKFSVISLAELGGEKGSFELRNAQNAAQGIKARIDWCIEQIDKNGFIGIPPAKL